MRDPDIYHFFEGQNDRVGETAGEGGRPSTGLLLQCPRQLRLSQAKAGRQEVHLGLPCGGSYSSTERSVTASQVHYQEARLEA